MPGFPNRSVAEHPVDAATGETLYLARQPILNGRRETCGYELLFRSGYASTAVFMDGTQATSRLLFNTFAEIGLDDVVGPHPAYVNFTREFLTGQVELPPRPDRLVVEVLENVEIDDAVIRGVRRLSKRGFRIALDDFYFHPAMEPLLEVADLVKLDIPTVPDEVLPDHVQQIKRWPVRVLAEKVETAEVFQRCRDLGCELFQGYFFARPTTLGHRTSQVNRTAVLQILAQLCDPDLTLAQLDQTLQRDPRLCYKVLRYVNSCQHSLLRPIDSIRHALAMLGIRGIRTLIIMLELAKLGGSSQEILSHLIVRGEMCQLLAEEIDGADPAKYATLGVLSTLEDLLGEPLESLLKGLPLADDLKSALLNGEGSMGAVLQCVVAFERAAWDRVACLGLTPQTIQNAYLKAVKTANALREAVPQD